MHRFALAALMAVACASNALALPEDGNRYHLIVITADTPSTHGRQLLQVMRHHPEASQISIRCHTHHYRTSDTLYRERYLRSLPPAELPILALANSTGGVVFKASGAAIPRGGDAIRDALVAAARLDQAVPAPHRLGPYAHTVGYVGQCGPDGCPSPYQPRPSPAVPDFRQPFGPDGPLDGAVPDSVDITAEGSLFALPSWAIPVGIGGVLLICLAGCFVVAGLALCCVLWLRR